VHLAKPLGAQHVDPLLGPGLHVDEPDLSQDPQVLRDLRLVEVKPIPDVVHRPRTTAEQLDEQFEQDARRSVKAGFVLDKLATQEELGLDQEELAAYVTEQAYRMGVQPDQLARQLSESGQLAAVAADVLRGKAMTLLAERSKVTDESGRNVDIKAIEAEAAEAADEGAGDVAADDADVAGDADGGEEPEA